jgi:type I restriction enzyme S subunit
LIATSSAIPIGTGVREIETWSPMSADLASEFEYIDIAAIDREQKVITTTARTRASDAPSRARQIVQKGDVLVSTVRPALNAVAVVPASLDGAIASTGFTVLRSDERRLHGPYLFHWVRGTAFIDEMVRLATGASYPAVSDRIIKASCVPVPFSDDPRRSLAEQKRIAAILDKADAIRRRRQEAARLADTLIPSVFYEMFGDPATNPKRFPIRAFDEVIADTQYGTAAKAETHGRGLPVLRMNNLTNDGNFDLTDLKWLELVGDEVDHYVLAKGDLLFNRTNSPELVGKSAVWKSDQRFAFAGYLIRVRFHQKEIAADYASAYLNSRYGKQMLRAHAQPSINMSNISASSLKRMNIMVPPITLQNKFSKHVDEVAQLRSANQHRIGEADLLFNALVQRAFRGEL